MIDLQPIQAFLALTTPQAWIQAALEHPDLLLIDHAHCEKKAAATALSLIHRYPQYPELLVRLSRLAREELRHFEQVLALLRKRKIGFRHLSASRYAAGLREGIATEEPWRCVDTLIVGAFIEARSCERFASLAPLLDPELQAFYTQLLASEARHFQDYLKLAQQVAGQDISDRVEEFRRREAELISAPDTEFRFHSGPVAGENSHC